MRLGQAVTVCVLVYLAGAVVRIGGGHNPPLQRGVPWRKDSPCPSPRLKHPCVSKVQELLPFSLALGGTPSPNTSPRGFCSPEQSRQLDLAGIGSPPATAKTFFAFVKISPARKATRTGPQPSLRLRSQREAGEAPKPRWVPLKPSSRSPRPAIKPPFSASFRKRARAAVVLKCSARPDPVSASSEVSLPTSVGIKLSCVCTLYAVLGALLGK